ncbi:MAG TPA: hypothetical protein VKB84_13590 [Candidatus Binataceae bacterium]|jgi:hypothetical protein|nr:hypothetical protein [Candidatus Binataceae bacterium]
MPRQDASTSAFEHVRQQAVNALNKLRHDIRTIETQLTTLRHQEEQLVSITGDGRVSTSNGAAARGGRMNWRVVLEKLPKRFKASDVRGVRGLANKRSGEIFAAITRWIDSGAVKRRERGVYERI